MTADRTPIQTALRAVSLCLLCSAALPIAAVAQDAMLIAELAADPAGTGPAAWHWTREHVVPRLGGAEALDPSNRLRIVLRQDGTVILAPGTLSGTSEYAHFELRIADHDWARGTLAFDGTEIWSPTSVADERQVPAVLRRLAARFGFEASTGWLELDVGTAIGNLMVGHADGDPIGELLTLGALECGDATLMIRGTEGGTTVLGKSGGGLALPAVMLALADRQAAREPDISDPDANLERWLLLAASARASELEEAARQLSRFDDPRAVRALERLLWDEGIVRLVAMHGLARLRAEASIAAIAAAADPKVPGSVEVAARAIVALLPESLRGAVAARMSSPREAPLATPTAETDSNPLRRPARSWGELAAALVVGVLLGGGLRRRPAIAR